MSNRLRPVSLCRKLIPFKFAGTSAAGPIAELTRLVFDKHPHVFPVMLKTLEETDTAAEPRIAFAEALQMLADPAAKQNRVREAFDRAEVELRREHFLMHFDLERAESDLNYRLDTLQLVGAVQYWSRMFRIHSNPTMDAIGQLTHLYTADARRDRTMNQFVQYLLESENREEYQKSPEQKRFVENCLILERDLFGAYRLAQFANRVFVFHSLSDTQLGASDETYGVLTEIDAFRTHGHFDITDEPAWEGRWRKITITCRPEEEELAPYNDFVRHDLVRDPVEVLFDETLVGRPQTVDTRIHVDGTLFPTTSSTSFELAATEDDGTYMTSLWKNRDRVTREHRPDKGAIFKTIKPTHQDPARAQDPRVLAQIKKISATAAETAKRAQAQAQAQEVVSSSSPLPAWVPKLPWK